jgi:hypothetical protein
MGLAMELGFIQEGVLSLFFNTSGLRVVEPLARSGSRWEKAFQI